MNKLINPRTIKYLPLNVSNAEKICLVKKSNSGKTMDVNYQGNDVFAQQFYRPISKIINLSE